MPQLSMLTYMLSQEVIEGGTLAFRDIFCDQFGKCILIWQWLPWEVFPLVVISAAYVNEPSMAHSATIVFGPT